MNMTSKDKEGPGAAKDEDECPICHELFKSITEKTFLPCAHYFHKDCINQWLAKGDSCPICRSFPNEDTTPAADNVYADADDENEAAGAYATFGAMPQPQQMEICTGSFNCYGRQNCIGCLNCTNCINCTDCVACTNCTNCVNCVSCTYCQLCTNCVCCVNCPSCINCVTLINCNNTTHGNNA